MQREQWMAQVLFDARISEASAREESKRDRREKEREADRTPSFLEAVFRR